MSQKIQMVDMDSALYDRLQDYSRCAQNLAGSFIDDVSAQRVGSYEVSQTVWEKAWDLVIWR